MNTYRPESEQTSRPAVDSLDAIKQAKHLLASACNGGGLTRAASCVTFYIRDPWWPDTLQLVCSPGVHYPEPMHGFFYGYPTSCTLEQEASVEEMYFPNVNVDSPLQRDPTRNHQQDPRRGDFIHREGIVSCAQFRLVDRSVLNALAWVSYRSAETFHEKQKEELRGLTRDL
ncbi:MAG: hypothetical protein MJA84_09370, partial [Firmicutes bacterium]|nr:hypothetical protein [Bacillota bacterium]